MLKPTKTNRKFYFNDNIDSTKKYEPGKVFGKSIFEPAALTDDYQEVPATNANLVSSMCEDGQHRPALDIDLPVELYPSSRPGHFHLYIDRPMGWEKYAKLLLALGEAGVLEMAYVDHCLERGMSLLRLPHIKKKGLTC